MSHHRDHEDEPSDPSLLVDVVVGAAAGAIGLMALDAVDNFIWQRLPASSRLRTRQVRPGGRDPAHEIAHRAAEALPFDPTPGQLDKAGDAVHVALGVTPAMAYAPLRQRAPAVSAGGGALFGLSLFLLQDEAMNTALKLGAKANEYPWADHARGLVAHVTYGIVVEGVLSLIDGVRRRF